LFPPQFRRLFQKTNSSAEADTHLLGMPSNQLLKAMKHGLVGDVSTAENPPLEYPADRSTS
jgi:hypothetical protein